MTSSHSKALGQSADDLNDALRHAEEAIRDLKLGANAVVPLSGDTYFCFGKTEGRWGFYLMKGEVTLKSEITASRGDLFSASIETRLLAAKAVPRLVQALREANDKSLREIRATITELEKYTDSLLEETDG